MFRVTLTFLLFSSSAFLGFCEEPADVSAPSLYDSGQAHHLPHVIAPGTAYSQTAAYWTVEEGWHTELHVRNNMGDENLILTPTLHSASGKLSRSRRLPLLRRLAKWLI